MKEARILMGMPITVEIVGPAARSEDVGAVFSYFEYIDAKFSTYKETSDISKINRGELPKTKWSSDVQTVFLLSEKTRKETDGYFDIRRDDGTYDPSGLVKGWAIRNAAELLAQTGFKNFYIDAGGDIEARGKNGKGEDWSVGIKNPFKQDEIVKVIRVSGKGVATSGTYIRGQHIYNPKKRSEAITDILSLTAIGPDIYEADRFATAAFAMGRRGIAFIEELPGIEGYMIDKNGIAVMTSGFETYTWAHPIAS